MDGVNGSKNGESVVNQSECKQNCGPFIIFEAAVQCQHSLFMEPIQKCLSLFQQPSICTSDSFSGCRHVLDVKLLLTLSSTS